MRGAERPGVAAEIAQPGRRADAPVLAAVGLEQDDEGERVLLGQRLVGAEALALRRPPAGRATGRAERPAAGKRRRVMVMYRTQLIETNEINETNESEGATPVLW